MPPTITNLAMFLDIALLIIAIWIVFAANAKRYHDLGKSGWNSLLCFIPIIGPPYLFLKLGVSKNGQEPNKYGPPVT